MQLWLKLQFCRISTQGPLRQCSMCWPSRTNNHVHERLAWRETLTPKCSGAHQHLLPHDNWLNDPTKPASAFMSPSCESIHRHIPTSIMWNFSVAMRSGLHVRLPTWVIHELIGETAEQWLPTIQSNAAEIHGDCAAKTGIAATNKKKVNLKYPLASNRESWTLPG